MVDHFSTTVTDDIVTFPLGDTSAIEDMFAPFVNCHPAYTFREVGAREDWEKEFSLQCDEVDAIRDSM